MEGNATSRTIEVAVFELVQHIYHIQIVQQNDKLKKLQKLQCQHT